MKAHRLVLALIAMALSCTFAVAQQAEEEASNSLKITADGVQQTPDTQAADEAAAAEPSADESSASEAPTTPTNTEADLHSIRYACTHADHTRRVEVDYLEPPAQLPCQVNYYKDTEAAGSRETLWEAQNTVGYCKSQADSLVQKLEGLGWSCETQ